MGVELELIVGSILSTLSSRLSFSIFFFAEKGTRNRRGRINLHTWEEELELRGRD